MAADSDICRWVRVIIPIAPPAGNSKQTLCDIDLCGFEAVISVQRNGCDDSGVFGCPASA